MRMARSRAQPIKCEYFWRLANQETVILPSLERKLRKNALCLNQSAISNFALYVIRSVLILVIKQIGLLPRSRPILLITRMILDRIGLHSVLLPLLIYSLQITKATTSLS